MGISLFCTTICAPCIHFFLPAFRSQVPSTNPYGRVVRNRHITITAFRIRERQAIARFVNVGDIDSIYHRYVHQNGSLRVCTEEFRPTTARLVRSFQELFLKKQFEIKTEVLSSGDEATARSGGDSTYVSKKNDPKFLLFILIFGEPLVPAPKSFFSWKIWLLASRNFFWKIFETKTDSLVSGFVRQSQAAAVHT